MDSNHDKVIQSQLCYRYTTRQKGGKLGYHIPHKSQMTTHGPTRPIHDKWGRWDRHSEPDGSAGGRDWVLTYSKIFFRKFPIFPSSQHHPFLDCLRLARDLEHAVSVSFSFRSHSTLPVNGALGG